MSKDEAQSFRARWQQVNAREVEELQTTPLEVKLQQFATLMGWVNEFGWEAELSKDEDVVRKRWARLRKEYRG
jgi:hypothetical protein